MLNMTERLILMRNELLLFPLSTEMFHADARTIFQVERFANVLGLIAREIKSRVRLSRSLCTTSLNALTMINGIWKQEC